MRKLSLFLVLAAVVAVSAVTLNPPTPVAASPADEYAAAAPYFGEGNIPPGCENDWLVSELRLEGIPSTYVDPKSFDNVCHHMRTDMNGLDSPQVDVVVMVPASPTAERDMRIMRQSVEMWEGGIDYLAEQMGLPWLAEGMDFHITVDSFDPAGENGGEFTTYPVVDPEIVVVAANPATIGYVGVGIDPVNQIFVNEDQLQLCHGVPNPFDIQQWESLPGFNSHHDGRSGTYVEDCGPQGGGGNICFAVNVGNDSPVIDMSSLFDLVSHEFGHCLTIGHVGDGAEGKWGATPTNDIMAYHSDPPGLSKCVSTLNVEGIALRMSKYLDANGDGAVNDADLLQANDQIGQGGDDFQIQHPDDHLYASGTGDVTGCPQPDTGVVPGPRTDWTPTPIRTSEPALSITSPENGAINDTGVFNVAGTVEHVSLQPTEVDPGTPTGSFDDADDDATSPLTEILDVNVDVTVTHVNAVMRLAELPPATDGASPTNYSVVIDGRKFDSFVYGIGFVQPRTWDDSGDEMPEGTSTWDPVAKTVTFNIPRSYLEAAKITSPYFVSTSASFGNTLTALVVDDQAPEDNQTIGISSASTDLRLPEVSAEALSTSVTFEHADGNTFYPENSTFGQPINPRHAFTLDVPQTSDVSFAMNWTDNVGGSDLDLYVTGAADSENLGATANAGPAGINTTEAFVLENVKGMLNLEVDPYFVTDPLSGSTYTLTATVTPDEVTIADTDLDGILDDADACPTQAGVAPTGCPDADGDGVTDADDVCPAESGDGADGCPIRPTEFVHLWVGGAIAATQAVDTANGPDSFNLPVALSEGTHEVRIDWEDNGEVVASRTITLTHNTDDDGDGVVNDADACQGFDDFDDLDRDGVADGCDTDSDADGHADHRDNCRNVSNPDQSNIDSDARGDICDSDKDGDGHSNDKEFAHGTDPADSSSYPGKAKTSFGL